MFELFVGDVVYYATTDQTLTKDRIKATCRTKVKGRSRHVYILYNGLSKLEDELLLSLKRAKNHFERSNIILQIPKGLDTD
ncbi:hypothetical protein GCM10028807_23420 [Spirosoma daeguense]